MTVSDSFIETHLPRNVDDSVRQTNCSRYSVSLLNFLTGLYIAIYPATSNKLSHHLFGNHCTVTFNIDRKRCVCGVNIFDKQDLMGPKGFTFD